MFWALIIEGHVWEITDIDPEGRFHPSFLWVPCDSTVTVGMTWDGTNFGPAP